MYRSYYAGKCGRTNGYVCLFLCAVAAALLLTGCSAPGTGGSSGSDKADVSSTASVSSAAAGSESGQSAAPKISVAPVNYAEEGAKAEAALNKRFKDCGSLDEAVTMADFPVEVPDKIGSDLIQTAWRAIPSEMIEVTYRNEKGDTVRLRKGFGQDDISGDYSTYNRFDFSIINELSVFQRFDDEGVRVATWTNGKWAEGTYTYAVTSTFGMITSVLDELVRHFN